MDEKRLAICREAFGRQMLAKAGIDRDDALREAFASIPRENFLGPPPWRMSNGISYANILSSDPVVLYQDVLVALQEERGVNNGSPSLHAKGLHELAPRPGESVCHIGAGGGYYTALLSHMVGPAGKVIAVEFDEALAKRAADNLKPYPNVEVVNGNGLEWPQESTDAVYVNFAIHRPSISWIDNLAPGGRLVFPLCAPRREGKNRAGLHSSRGGLFLFRRMQDEYRASYLSPAFFVWGEAVTGSVETYEVLDAAFRRGGMENIRRLRWKTKPEAGEWYSDENWGLVAEPAE